MEYKDTNACHLNNMNLCDLLKLLNIRIQSCIVKRLDPSFKCPDEFSERDCNKCIEYWINTPYKGGF